MWSGFGSGADDAVDAVSVKQLETSLFLFSIYSAKLSQLLRSHQDLVCWRSV